MRNIITNIGTDYFAFAVTAVLALIVTLVYLWWKEQSSGNLSCPGLKPTDEENGNLSEITKDGGLHQFLLSNHKKLGPIFSFYWGKELAVSLGSPRLFKDVQTLFDRPENHFSPFKPLFGEHSIQYANSGYGQRQRKLHDRFYSLTTIKSFFSLFVDVGKELVAEWSSIPEGEHVPLREHMLKIAIKSIIKITFPPDYMKGDDTIKEVISEYEVCWTEIRIRLHGDFPEPGSEREKRFLKSRDHFREKFRSLVQHRQAMKETSTQNFLDVLLQDDDLGLHEDQIVDTLVTYFIAGFHTTGNMLSWLIYFVCSDSAVRTKLMEEIAEVVDDSEITFEHMEKLKYTKMVIDETLRCSILAPYAARYSEYDIVVGGHIIPKQTPIILSLGSVLQDEKIYPEPTKFDPERFRPEKAKERRSLSFEPFGFAGKRKCPGYRLAYYDSMVFLIEIFRNFDVNVVDIEKVEMVHSFVTEPKEEIWITLKHRNTSDID